MIKQYKVKRLFLIVIMSALLGCSGSLENNMGDVAATINDFKLTKKEFQLQLVNELEYDDTYKTTAKAKNAFLNTIIQKELLTQEAKKMGLDRDEKFIAAIEKYWQATLIKHLMETKNKEIRHMVSVSEKDVQQMYEEQKSLNSNLPPFSDVEADITRAALEKKRGQAMALWIQALHTKAEIKINQAFIND